MARSGLAYKVLGGTRFYDRKEIKDVMAYLCLVNNTNDNLRLKRIINLPKRAIGGATIDAIEQIAAYEGVSMFTIIERCEPIHGLGPLMRKAEGVRRADSQVYIYKG